MASFMNESTNMKFSLTVDESAKTVSVSKISNSATADTLNTVATSFKPLFVATPTTVRRTSNDLIVEE